MKFRPTLLELLLVVAIVAILAATFLPTHHHRRLIPVRENEMYGYWIALPEAHEAFRLFLTNGGSGWLGEREIFTNLYRVTSWHITNRFSIVINLNCVTDSNLPPEYIKGYIPLGKMEINGERGGTNQDGEHWKRDITFYREDIVLKDIKDVSFIMTNQPVLNETNIPAR